MSNLFFCHERGVTMFSTEIFPLITSFPLFPVFTKLQASCDKYSIQEKCSTHNHPFSTITQEQGQKVSANYRRSSREQKWKKNREILTITTGKSVTPLMILLTNNWLLITQCVSWVTCKWNTRANRKAAAMATTIDWDSRIKTRVWLHFHTWESHHTGTNSTESSGSVYMCVRVMKHSKAGLHSLSIQKNIIILYKLLQAIQHSSTRHFYQPVNQPYFHIWCWSRLQSGYCLWWTTGTGRWT